MDTATNTMHFTLNDGVFEQLVEVRFADDSQNSSLDDFVSSYNSAQGDAGTQAELVLQFLKTICD